MADRRHKENGRKAGPPSHNQQSDRARHGRGGGERQQSEGRSGGRQKPAGRGNTRDMADRRGGQAPARAAARGSNGTSQANRSASAAGSGQGNPRPAKQPGAVAGSSAGVLPMAGRRKGDWYEIRLPEQYGSAPAAAMLRFLPLPPKLAGKLLQDNGIQKSGNLLKLRLFPRERPGMEPDWHELNILFEDDFMLIVNKPVGMEVHPSAHGQKGTLANAVAAYFEMTGKACKVRPVHRLDKDTTGPVVFAKNEAASVILEKSLKDKKIDRLYIALAEGRINPPKGVINAPIGQDRLHSTRRRVSETGEPAVTHYEVTDRLVDHSLVRLRLETGRTHQIRVHLAHIGHPVAGDGMYGGKRTYISRQALHGEKLVCFHPWSGEKIHVTAPLPEDMLQAVEALRKGKDR